MKKYYPGEPVNIHIQSLKNIIQENNWLITAKKRVRVNYHYFGSMENGKFSSMPQTRRSKPFKQKLATMNRL